MSQLNSMKQIGVKNMGVKIELMEWSNKMDLLAIGNDKGEVLIQRLNWQKICTFPPPSEGIRVRALSWQPDEKIIAIAYSNGRVSLMDVEKEEEINSFQCDSDMKTMTWTRTSLAPEFYDSYNNKSKIDHENFLCALPNLSSLSSTARKTDYSSSKSFAKSSPNFLVISLTSGKVLLSVFGVLPCGTIDIKDHVGNPDDYEILDVRMSSSFEEVFVFIRDEGNLKLLVFQNDILSKYSSSLLNLAMKHSHILETLNYVNDTIQCIIEAWETVLLEMDNKLTKYANSQPEGSLSADFLELLLFGYPSESLEQFLTRELTEKGLKKLGNSIELSYSTIQSLVVKSLHTAATNLFFHLNLLKGLSRNGYCYRTLLTDEATDHAVASAGSFVIKILELQQTIDKSVNDYKIFWCWLYGAIVRLIDESVPDEMASFTQEDTIHLAEFLNNFDECIIELEDGTVEKRKFNLERVGQYLEDKNLQFPQKIDLNHQWNKLLDDNECLRDSPLLYPHKKEFSLIQQHNALKKSIRDLFAKPNNIIQDSFALKRVFNCGVVENKEIISYPIGCDFIVDETENCDLLALATSEKEIVLVEFKLKTSQIRSARLHLSEGIFSNRKFAANFEDVTLTRLQFYNEFTLSMLLQGTLGDKNLSYFVQYPISEIRNRFSNHGSSDRIDFTTATVVLNSLDFIEPSYLKSMEGVRCTSIAVSGSRKVASVLSDNCRKVRVYEMEVEDDDDEVDMSQNTVLDNSKESNQSQE